MQDRYLFPLFVHYHSHWSQLDRWLSWRYYHCTLRINTLLAFSFHKQTSFCLFSVNILVTTHKRHSHDTVWMRFNRMIREWFVIKTSLSTVQLWFGISNHIWNLSESCPLQASLIVLGGFFYFLWLSNFGHVYLDDNSPKVRFQNLDVDVINKKLLIYFFLFIKLFLKFFFCFAFAGITNIEENEIFVSMNHSMNLQYA